MSGGDAGGRVAPETPADAVAIRDADARVVAQRVFQDFDLNDDELGRASRVLAMISGPPDLDRILERAARKPGEPWNGVSADRRQDCIQQVLAFHCAPADMEQMALRTGAGLLLVGDADLGRKILEAAPDSAYGTEPAGGAYWARVAQAGVYAFLISVLVIETTQSGLLLYLIPAIAAVVVVVLLVWLVERSRWKLKRGEGEAQRYRRALDRIGAGVPAAQLFGPDGSLRPTSA